MIMKSNPQVSVFNINSIEIIHAQAGKRGTRNRGRYQVAQSSLSRLYYKRVVRDTGSLQRQNKV